MSAERKDALMSLEKEVRDDLYRQAADERNSGLHRNFPITDGVVDEARYLTSRPKILWLLKEPWEIDIEQSGGGDWSITKNLIPSLIEKRSIKNRGHFANISWVTHAVQNGYLAWEALPWISENPAVAESLLNIAYINVSKYPGQKVSYPPFLKRVYRQNQRVLLKQIETIAPDIVIGGGTLWLFLEDLGISTPELMSFNSVKACHKNGRLYVDAYHPAQRGGSEWYVNDLVAAIKSFRHHWDDSTQHSL